MLTPDQEKWISHLPIDKKVTIIPFDPTIPKKFAAIKQKIEQFLGDSAVVEHHGATSLGISGQDEIDVYLPVSPSEFVPLTISLEKIFGSPRSLYPLRRARFVTIEDGKHIDVFSINKETDDWNNMVRFENYLKTNTDYLNKYRQLKEEGNGLSIQEYYRRKLE